MNIEHVICELGLDTCEDLKINKISGGQLKRVSVGQELISRPDLLLLDEPTTGLDSSCCCELLDYLKQLAITHQMLILLSIHQPSTKLFMLFDKIYFMSHHGVCIYEGRPQQAHEACEQMGLPCPGDSNPADHLMEIACHDHGSENVESMAKQHAKRYEGAFEEELKRMKPLYVKKPKHHFFFHSKILFHRSWRAICRDPVLMLIRLSGHMLIPLLLAHLFGYTIGQISGCPKPSLKSLEFGEVVDILSRPQELTEEYLKILHNVGYLFG